MRGISEERLKEIAADSIKEVSFVAEVLLARECKELSEWKHIGSDTPKDRHVLLLTPDNVVIEGYFVDLDGGYWVDGLNHDEIKPKYWQELPPPPKE